MKANLARTIRRSSQRLSQCHNHLGLSELFLAPPSHAMAILSSNDVRLKCYLLGFTNIPPIRDLGGGE